MPVAGLRVGGQDQLALLDVLDGLRGPVGHEHLGAGDEAVLLAALPLDLVLDLLADLLAFLPASLAFLTPLLAFLAALLPPLTASTALAPFLAYLAAVAAIPKPGTAAAMDSAAS
ncbi:hypothetical protein, partial [Streptomyces sp. TRM68367]|uniref:hypothetical protein n=1 Tax=Streptomyces sp. TRM68367 TaxID=2758415 RepID=UPI001CA9B953